MNIHISMYTLTYIGRDDKFLSASIQLSPLRRLPCNILVGAYIERVHSRDHPRISNITEIQSKPSFVKVNAGESLILAFIE